MSNINWMDLMGISKAKPTESNCPRVLSPQVRRVWPSIVKDNMTTISGMSHEIAWNFALATVFDKTSDEGYAWLDQRFSGRPAQEKIVLDVKARRALTVAIMDTTDALYDLTIGNPERAVSYDSGVLTMTTTANCRLAKGVAEMDWLTKLVKNRFKVFGYEYRLFGLPAGSKIRFLNRPMGGIQYIAEMNIPATFIPNDAASPAVNPAVYEKFILDKVWLPAVRTFKFKTTRRKNSLL
jgi:hypothetical protein